MTVVPEIAPVHNAEAPTQGLPGRHRVANMPRTTSTRTARSTPVPEFNHHPPIACNAATAPKPRVNSAAVSAKPAGLRFPVEDMTHATCHEAPHHVQIARVAPPA